MQSQWTDEEFILIQSRLGHALEWCGVKPSREKVDPEKVERDLVRLFGISSQTTNAGFIYFIQHGNHNAYKIGLAVDPEKRLRELQIGNPEILTLVHTIETDNTIETENRLHNALSPHLIRGEWYSLSPEHIERIKAGKSIIAQSSHKSP